jgi:hypothetical protein
MAIASFLTPDLVISQNLRVSTAGLSDVQYYNAAAYRRMEQVYKGNQDDMLINTMFPKASIEILLMLEESWWPYYTTKAAMTILWQTKQGQLVTGFKPELLVKTNQWLVELETFKVVEKFYESIISDNANINEKDQYNYKVASERFLNKWNDVYQASHFYDVNNDGLISKIEENNEMDLNYFSEDRRYF